MVLHNICSVGSLMALFGGILVSLVSVSVMGLWVGVEINFLGAVCYMCGSSVNEGESVMKYFVVQVLGSCLLILGILMMVNCCFAGLVDLMLLLGVLVKLGGFPFQFWVPSIMSGLSWSGCFVVSVVQKIIILWLLCNLNILKMELEVLEVIASLTCVVGCLGGLGVLSYRVLLGYSSLVHLGFLMILCCVSSSGLWYYLIFYMILNLGLMGSLWSLKVYSFSDLMKEKKMSELGQIWWVSLYFLSLAGLPPFSGCVLKILFLLLCWNFMPLGCIICVLSSVVSLYFYLGVVMNMSIFWGKGLSLFGDKNESKYDLVSMLSVSVNLVIGFMAFLCLGLCL
uniref:NADH-ubiquinone oxidoreductase chain 2 n=1 Tax=Antigona lamellaris TaxID=345433 RepID=A0A866UBR6_9BIVA|nr:NADH dehydrogenase subunit 2 [Antigona lamellaris]